MNSSLPPQAVDGRSVPAPHSFGRCLELAHPFHDLLSSLPGLASVPATQISAENPTGAKGAACRWDPRPQRPRPRPRRPGREPGSRLEGAPLHPGAGGRDRHPGRDPGSGLHQPDLDLQQPAPVTAPWSCASSGTARPSPRWRCRWAISSRSGTTRSGTWSAPSPSSSAPTPRLRQPLSDALPAPRPDHARERGRDRRRGRRLPDPLQGGRGRRRRRLLPRPVAAVPDPARASRAHDRRRRRRARSLRGHLPRLDRPLHRPVGRGRGQVLHRRRVPDPGRQRHRGPLRRRPGLLRRWSRAALQLALRRSRRGDAGDGPRKLSLHRWHLLDSIGFAEDLRVTVQALGWWPDRTYQPLTDDVASVACWYQLEPHRRFPTLPPLAGRWER